MRTMIFTQKTQSVQLQVIRIEAEILRTTSCEKGELLNGDYRDGWSSQAQAHALIQHFDHISELVSGGVADIDFFIGTPLLIISSP